MQHLSNRLLLAGSYTASLIKSLQLWTNIVIKDVSESAFHSRGLAEAIVVSKLLLSLRVSGMPGALAKLDSPGALVTLTSLFLAPLKLAVLAARLKHHSSCCQFGIIKPMSSC